MDGWMWRRNILTVIASFYFTRSSEESVEFSWLTLGIDIWWETGLSVGKKIRLNFVPSPLTPQPWDILMTPSRVHRCWRHPLSRLSKRDPLISPQNNPPQTLSSHSLAISFVPSRTYPCPTTPADFLSSLAFVSERALISGANFASLPASLNYNRETPGWSCRQSHWGRGPRLQDGRASGGGWEVAWKWKRTRWVPRRRERVDTSDNFGIRRRFPRKDLKVTSLHSCRLLFIIDPA